MYISKFQVSNFKSYRDSAEVELKPGFNIVTGQNNAGKTALLEALALRFAPRPHRSIRTMPVPGALPGDTSAVRVTFMLSGEELLRSLQAMASPQFFPSPNIGIAQDVMNKHLDNLLQLEYLRLDMRLEMQNDERWIAEDPLFFGIYRPEPHPQGHMMVFPVSANDGRLATVGAGQYRSPAPDVRIPLAQFFRSRIYRFRAERFNLGRYAFGDSPVLLPDASNLPQVLNQLDSNPARFDRLNATVTEILPQVRQVSVRPSGSNQVEILVWSHDPITERGDLAIPLDECGSGIGQVLAILYVVMTSDHPQTVIVDEPQSFLHPGAVTKLVEVLKKYPQHQYIFATHSPAVITASDPATFTIVRATDGESVLEVMDPGNAKHLQTYLSEIGARLSDVFGADKILWVEGQTEEECFPLVVRKIAKKPLMGTVIVGIRQVGDLQGRERKKVLELYLRLSRAKTLLPPAIAFVFDKECLTHEQKDDLTRMDRDRVRFFPRRMYENYLLDAAAVAAVMNSITGFRDRPILEDEVRQFFETKRGERKEPGQQLRYFCRGIADVPIDWESSVDAAKLLEDSFRELSGGRASYEKTTHSVAITEWLIENRPAALGEVAEFLAPLLS
jgi:energy-coupling factor transporter ATP-binding protein EcfA2